MIKRELKTKTAYIQEADFTGVEKFESENITEALRAVLARIEDKDREWSPAPDSDLHRVIVQVQEIGGALCGRLAQYEEGKGLEVIRRPEKTVSEKYKVADEDLPEAPEGYLQDLVESSFFFACRGNKLAVLQSVPLKFNAFEDHLNWLLLGKKEGHKAGTILLKHQISAKWRQKILKYGVDEISIGSNLEEVYGHEGTADQGTVDITKKIFGSWLKKDADDELAQNGLRNLRFEGVHTEVKMRVSTKADEKAHAMLNVIALNLMDGISGLTIKLGNGEIKKGDMLIHKEGIPVEYFDGRAAISQIYSGLSGMLAQTA